MKKLIILLLSAELLLAGCSIKPAITDQYKLDAFSEKILARHPSKYSILITQPEAVSGYQTDQMLYVKKPFEVTPFVHSAWIGPPADMLLPLMLQSIQRSGYFYAVSSSPNSEQTDYRLDTQLLELQQSFLSKPSKIDFTAKVVLTNVRDSRVIASRIITKHINSPQENPYGGVIAANQATKEFTNELSQFIITHIQRDKH